jgi:hypothetical protein
MLVTCSKFSTKHSLVLTPISVWNNTLWLILRGRICRFCSETFVMRKEISLEMEKGYPIEYVVLSLLSSDTT